MNKITWPALKVLAVIQWWYDTYHWPPTYRDLAELFGQEVNAIANHIASLRATGLLADNRHQARALVPTFIFLNLREGDKQ